MKIAPTDQLVDLLSTTERQALANLVREIRTEYTDLYQRHAGFVADAQGIPNLLRWKPRHDDLQPIVRHIWILERALQERAAGII